MKRIFVVVLSVVALLVLLFLIVYKVIGPTPKAQPAPTQDPFKNAAALSSAINTDRPYQAALTCYTWYLGKYIANSSTPGLDLSDPDAQRCFSSQMLRNWNQKTGDDWSNGDPVLLAQDYYNSWQTNIAAKVIQQVANIADVQVTLGTGAEAHSVNVRLVSEQGLWKIDSVTQPTQ